MYFACCYPDSIVGKYVCHPIFALVNFFFLFLEKCYKRAFLRGNGHRFPKPLLSGWVLEQLKKSGRVFWKKKFLFENICHQHYHDILFFLIPHEYYVLESTIYISCHSIWNRSTYNLLTLKYNIWYQNMHIFIMGWFLYKWT